MDNPLQGALQKMGSNFIVAAFVPAMGFILLSALAFFPVLPEGLVSYLGWNVADPSSTTVITGLLFTTILGFTLFTLSTYIYKSFEGYTFILGLNTPLRRAFIQRQKRRVRKIMSEKSVLEKELKKIREVLGKEMGDEKSAWLQRRQKRYEAREESLKSRLYSVVALFDASFPPSEHLVLPSRFGNILRAAEMYPGSRYSIDAVSLWGRMAHVIPPDAMEKIDQANNQCLFLLNSSLLAATFSLLSFFSAGYLAVILLLTSQGSPQFSFMKINPKFALDMESVGIYIVLGIISGAVAWFFYQASLLNVSQYGNMIRTSYDLYRFNLLEKLSLKIPNTLDAEQTLWQKLSEFFVGGDAFGKVSFNYHFFAQADSPTTTESEEDVSVDEFLADSKVGSV